MIFHLLSISRSPSLRRRGLPHLPLSRGGFRLRRSGLVAARPVGKVGKARSMAKLLPTCAFLLLQSRLPPRIDNRSPEAAL